MAYKPTCEFKWFWVDDNVAGEQPAVEVRGWVSSYFVLRQRWVSDGDPSDGDREIWRNIAIAK